LILLNNYLRRSAFPGPWKQAKLRPILKDIQKDPTNVKSYKPIALLPVMAKMYERIIVDRVQDLYQAKDLDSDTQFGFKPGRGTDDALCRIIRTIRNCDSRYAVVTFFDIAGAFDNLWWPAILWRIMETNCSSQLFNILKEYFNDRQMMLTSSHDKVIKEMTKGCPQGFIIGPLAWNWCMDELLDKLQELETRRITTVAYADDLALIVCKDSRTKIEESAGAAVKTLLDWCKIYKLQIAIEKTRAMMAKGSFQRDRMPRIFVDGKKIMFTNEHKYLGIYIDEKLSFIPHVQRLRDKIHSISGLLKKTIHDEWGLKRKAYLLLYKCLYLPAVTYGAVAWFDRVSHSHVERTLSSIQRKLLLYMTQVCRTTSTTAMQIISGCMPMGLEVIQKALLTKVRWMEPVIWETYRFTPEEDLQEGWLKKEKEKLEIALLNYWQQNWDTNEHGRITYRFIPSVRFFRENGKWFRPNRLCTYLITGYGSINKFLFERNCVPSADCPRCPNEEETVEHMLFHCPLYNSFRNTDMTDLLANDDWTGFLKDESAFMTLNNYATNIFRIRTNYMLNASGNSPPPRG